MGLGVHWGGASVCGATSVLSSPLLGCMSQKREAAAVEKLRKQQQMLVKQQTRSVTVRGINGERCSGPEDVLAAACKCLLAGQAKAAAGDESAAAGAGAGGGAGAGAAAAVAAVPTARRTEAASQKQPATTTATPATATTTAATTDDQESESSDDEL